jgi:hypothetical protein
LILSFLLTVNAPGFGRTPSVKTAEPASKITIWVFNHARVSGEALAQAKEEAARILSRAGVEIDWLDCPTSAAEVDKYPGCEKLPGSTGLVLRIRPQSPATRMVRKTTVFGYALLPEDGGFGIYADVYDDGVALLANGRDSLRPVMLGHLMAHEIGHLLLNTARHTATGLMHSPWNGAELQRAARGGLLFSKKEIKRIQARVRDRMRDEEAFRTEEVREGQ